MIRLDLNSPFAAPRPAHPDKPAADGPGPLALEHWRRLFDVTDAELKARLVAVLDPRADRLGAEIATKPELYLPFWTAALLVVCLFVFAGLSWTGSTPALAFDLLSLAGSYVFGYLVCFPALLHLYARIQNARSELFALVALMGYSLAFYVPAAALCALPHPLLQWACLLAAFALSARFIWRNLRGVVAFEGENSALLTTLLALGVHALFTLCLKLRFFGPA